MAVHCRLCADAPVLNTAADKAAHDAKMHPSERPRADLEAEIIQLREELRFALEVLSLKTDLDTGEELTYSGNDVDTWQVRSLDLLGYEWEAGKIVSRDTTDNGAR